ncbi:MAG: TRAP transporter small permease [Proteobacteria bacterium]|nr:TRAP transporter small permease [Pseudomonadota bacterium]
MKRLIRIIDGISAVVGGLAGVMLCIGLVLTCGEILLRTAFDRTLFITDEYSGYLMCGLTFCALGYTLKEKGHIRMTIIHGIVKDRKRDYLDTICYAVGCIFSAFITFHTGQLFLDSVATGSQSMQISATYLAIPQFFMPFGALIITLQFFSEFLKSILVLKGDTSGLVLREEIQDLGR